VLAFERPNGWLTVLNGGAGELELPELEVLVTSGELKEGKHPPRRPPGYGWEEKTLT
jgi:hypothetical protein